MVHLSSMENKIMDSILKTAITAALHAGEEILRIYKDPRSDFEIERKSDNSPLTIADKKSNDIIMEYLINTPYPIISEENKTIDYETRKTWDTLWIVDPLDGTKEFIKRNGEFTVNIALVHEGRPILGVIYIPVKKTLYYGSLEGGAFRIDDIIFKFGMNFDSFVSQAIALPVERQDSSCIVVASRSHMSEETTTFIEKLQQKNADVQLVSIGSSIKICLVADGTADIYPRFAPTMEWDTAAGHAIAKAAGKELYHEDGKTPLTYNKENLLNPWFIVK